MGAVFERRIQALQASGGVRWLLPRLNAGANSSGQGGSKETVAKLIWRFLRSKRSLSEGQRRRIYAPSGARDADACTRAGFQPCRPYPKAIGPKLPSPCCSEASALALLVALPPRDTTDLVYR
eukprot:2757483-Pleurochrysis_carterae.AAC.1